MLEDLVLEGKDGSLEYDFSETDTRIDYLVSRGFSLLICMNFLPRAIAKDKTVVSANARYKGKRLYTSVPSDYKLWQEVCARYVAHLIERYGEDLLIIFTADHGEMLGNHGVWGKHNCAYREVWSLPLFVDFPDGRGAGTVSDALVNTCDILPTCLEAAGVEPKKPSDGVSLYSPANRTYTFSEGEGFVAVTDGRFKYIHVQKQGEHFRELLDTLEDPCECENRISDPRYAADLARLRGAMIEHFMEKVLP